MTAATARSTLEAMRNQEAIYWLNKNPAASFASSLTTVVEVQQAIVALENIHDLCQMQDRETLVIATSYLLRYLHSNHASSTVARPVGVVALVCFYMAVKIHQTTALPLTSLTDLYQRFFSSSCHDDCDLPKWEHVELEVCCALQWRLHPPMPMAFVDQHLPFITGSSSSSSSVRRHRRRAQARLEAAFRADPIAFTGDYRASSLAQAALKVTAKNHKTVDDADTACDEDAVVFLRDCAASTPCTTTIKKTSRKRCVTPPPSCCYGGIMSRPSKKIKTLEDHASWTNSPRSALTVAEEA